MPALDEVAGRELVSQVRALFGASIEMQGTQIVLKNGQASPAPLATAALPVASQSAAGVMSAEDKAKLDGVSAGATSVSVDAELSASSANPVRNSAVTAALDAKAASSHTHTSSQVTGLVASRVLVSSSSGAVATSSVTSTELGYLDGVTGPVQAQLYARAPLASPAFTGSPTATTAATGDNSTRVATTAFVQREIAASAVGAATYKGTAASESDIGSTSYRTGWYWVVSAAGVFFGEECEVGDMVFCNSDKGSAASSADFDVVQSNVTYVTVEDVRSWFS